MTETLTTARNHYADQQGLAVVGKAAALRAWRNRKKRGQMAALVAAVILLQNRSAENGSDSVPAMLKEQDIEAPPNGALIAASLAGTAANLSPLESLFKQADTVAGLARMVVTEVLDAGRLAQEVEVALRPDVKGYIRYLNPPSCGRCTILAGRFYPWSTGFLRHPNCDCVMLPTNVAPGANLITDPMDAFKRGQISGLSGPQREAIEMGADIGRVINAYGKGRVYSIGGGLTATKAVKLKRGQHRLTVTSILKLASDREEAIKLLRRHGYIN